MAWVLRTIIVPDGVVGIARAACEALAGAGGSGMFSVPLSESGRLPPTHWASSGAIEEEFAHLLATPEALSAVVTSMGMGHSSILPVLEASDVSDVGVESWESVLSRLGLKLITPDEEAS